MRFYDLSPVISSRLAVFPGDLPFRREIALSLASGDNLDLSSIHTTLHLGAHADSPGHTLAGGAGIGERPLEPYFGPCHLMRVAVGRGERIRPAHLPEAPRAPRLLLYTGTFPDPEHWNDDFASLSPELVDHLADRGVVLVGIDTPSIDPAKDKVLSSHQAVTRRDLCILEGLVLEGVPEGLYTLLALPLRIEGADASPVRAVLVAGLVGVAQPG